MSLHYGLLQMTTDEILRGGETPRVNDYLVSAFLKLISWILVCRIVSAGSYV